MNKSHNLLFHKTLKNFKEYQIKHKKMIVGVSAGLDSMVLMHLLQELSSVCQLQLLIAYIHHGSTDHKKTQNYRDKAQKIILQTCETKHLSFFSSQSKKQLKSEEDFRNFRHAELKKLLKQQKADLIVLAHNQNDLQETRLINLIRGSGPQGLNSMPFYQTPYLRPLLDFSRKEIKKYAQICKIKFLEDPSNTENSYFRNWMRNKWLKNLEDKRPGSVKSLSISLDTLSKSIQMPLNSMKALSSDMQKSSSFILTSNGINRKVFFELSLEDQKRVLAFYMRKLQLSDYGQSHIQELLKHNKRTEKNFQIQLLKKTWIFTKDEIKIKP